MNLNYNLVVVLIYLRYFQVKCNLDPFITGGSFASYSQYPHSILLIVNCRNQYICGGSVLNQKLVLTAAHCLDECSRRGKVEVRYGHSNIQLMKKTFMRKFVNHKEYNTDRMNNDIGLILTRKVIPLNSIVKRVILMRSPPNLKKAYVSGWGLDEYKTLPESLKYTRALIQEPKVCQYMGILPPGVFCAGPVFGIGAANQGDSGGALVIKKYIQVGIVSFKVDELSLVAYTNTTYFLDWIIEHSWGLFCLDKRL